MIIPAYVMNEVQKYSSMVVLYQKTLNDINYHLEMCLINTTKISMLPVDKDLSSLSIFEMTLKNLIAYFLVWVHTKEE